MHGDTQDCQMVYFRTKNPDLGKKWRVLEWKMLVYFMVIWNILWSFGIFYGHLVYLWSFGNVVIVGIFYTVLVYCGKKNLATLVTHTVQAATRDIDGFHFFRSQKSFSGLHRNLAKDRKTSGVDIY
jgi:hypothetical protein